MSIVTNGWGSSVIGTWGWGSGEVLYIPTIIAEYLEHHAYSCILKRDYAEITDREAGTLLFRIPLDPIPERSRETILERLVVGPLASRGNVNYVVSRNYVDLISRDRGDVLLRVRMDEIPDRIVSGLLERIPSDIIVRSSGWPDEAVEICEE